jgi:hypothetical protein
MLDLVLRSSRLDRYAARFFAARSPATYGVRQNTFRPRQVVTVAGHGKRGPCGAPRPATSDAVLH